MVVKGGNKYTEIKVYEPRTYFGDSNLKIVKASLFLIFKLTILALYFTPSRGTNTFYCNGHLYQVHGKIFKTEIGNMQL